MGAKKKISKSKSKPKSKFQPQSDSIVPKPDDTKARIVTLILSFFVTAVFPFLLIIANARMVMSPEFLQFEYMRAGFPKDYYGFTVDDRLKYGPHALDYLLHDQDIGYLANLKFSSGKPLFNQRELTHMRDVKKLTQVTFAAAVFVAVLALGAAFALAKQGLLWKVLFQGSLLTLSLIVATGIAAAAINWTSIFVFLHTLIFEIGTYQFPYSDTLIRLYPLQFWFDAILTSVGLTILQALLVLLFIYFRNPKSGRRPSLIPLKLVRS